MVLSASYHEDDPRSVYKPKKLKATVQTKTWKHSQLGIITSGKSVSDSQINPATSTIRSHTGHGRYGNAGSTGSHTIDPSYYTADVREDRASNATRRSVSPYSREQSEPEGISTRRTASAYSREQPEDAANSSVSARIAAYKKNAKTVSAPKVSKYSVVANSDRYLQSPMAPVEPGTPVVEVTPVITRRLSNTRAPIVSSPRSAVSPVAEPASNSSSKSGKSSKNRSTKSESLDSKEEVDTSLDQAFAQSQQYWANIKKKQREQRAARRIQRAQENRFMACGVYEDDSTLESNNTEMSSTASWNLLDNILISQKDDLGLVSKEELLCDFQESGVDKIKELHQYLKSLTVDNPGDLVGRDIFATFGNDDDSSKSSYSDEESQKKSLVARFAAILAKLDGGNDEAEPAENNGTERKTTVHTVKYNHKRETNKRKMRLATAKYMAAVAASNSSVEGDTSRSAISSKSSKGGRNLRGATSKEPRGVAPTRNLEEEAIMNATRSTSMADSGSAVSRSTVSSDSRSTLSSSDMVADTGSAVSVKSVRFSEEVETHEPEEVKTPDVPSLMDDQVEDDEISSVESSPEPAPVLMPVQPIAVVEDSDSEEAPKKKGFLKKLMRHTKRKNNKKKGVHSGPFQPTLERMDEEGEVEKEDNAVKKTVDAPSAADTASTTSTKSDYSTFSGNSGSTYQYEVPHGVPHAPGEGFELIAGCTKTGKKAIMIAKAKNAKRHSEDPIPAKQETASLDPPPSTTATTTNDDKKDAASVVANAQGKRTPAYQEGVNEERMELEEDEAAKQNEILTFMDEYVNKALEVIRQHAKKHGVSERELMEHVDERDNESVGSHEEETDFMSEGDSRYNGRNSVAYKLMDAFESIFSTGGNGKTEEDDESLDSDGS